MEPFASFSHQRLNFNAFFNRFILHTEINSALPYCAAWAGEGLALCPKHNVCSSQQETKSAWQSWCHQNVLMCHSPKEIKIGNGLRARDQFPHSLSALFREQSQRAVWLSSFYVEKRLLVHPPFLENDTDGIVKGDFSVIVLSCGHKMFITRTKNDAWCKTPKLSTRHTVMSFSFTLGYIHPGKFPYLPLLGSRGAVS